MLGASPLGAGLWTPPRALSLVVGSNIHPVQARQADQAGLIGGALLAAGFVLSATRPARGLGLFVAGSIAVSLCAQVDLLVDVYQKVLSQPTWMAWETSECGQRTPV